ncbi:MAG: CHAD domain-containing protein [Thermoanaerobaculia bacterium]
MTYAFVASEKISDAVRRILAEQVDRAIAELEDPRQKPAKRVHDARKRFKEIRAVLRMVRGPLGEEFAIENRWFRDAGRDFSDVRDAEARVEAAVKLRQSARSSRDKRLLTRARTALMKHRDGSAFGDIEPRIANLVSQLPVARARLVNLPDLDDRFATIGGGLARTYADGRQAFNAVRDSPTDEIIHEWRKRVKDHWYHVQLLRHVWPELMKPYGDIMAQLSSTLGDRHDLDMLRAVVGADRSAFGSARSVVRLAGIIDSHRRELLTAALILGSRVYAEDPKSWRERMRGYWRAWKRGSDAT